MVNEFRIAHDNDRYRLSFDVLLVELFDLLEVKADKNNPNNGVMPAEGETVEQAIAIMIEVKLDAIEIAVSSKIDALTDQAGNALSDLANKTTEELKTAAAEGAEKLKATLKNKIGGVFGSSTASAQSSTNNVLTSLLSWAYSDYLQLFLLIALLASPEAVLLRTADVIELNMQQINKEFGYVEETITTQKEVSRLWGLIKYTKNETKTEKKENEKAFKLNKSYTYLSIEATVEVKPLLLTLPLVSNTVENSLTGTKWYQIQYSGTLGY